MHLIVLLITLGATALMFHINAGLPLVPQLYRTVSATAIYQCTKLDSILRLGLFTPGWKLSDN